MNLVSCDNCGIVLDKDRIKFPETYDYNPGDVTGENAFWNGEEYVPCIPCPVCAEPIKEKE